MATQLSNLSVTQLKRAVTIKEKIEALEAELAAVLDSAPEPSIVTSVARRKKRKMSAATKAKMAASQQARWARIRQSESVAVIPVKEKAKDKVLKPK
jgi:hypothetical protein